MNALIVSPNAYGYGALLVGGFLEHHGTQVSIIKELHHDLSEVDLVGLSLHSVLDILACQRFVRETRTKMPKATFVVGGSAAFVPKLVFKLLPDIDIVVPGEGEEAVVDIVHHLREGRSLDDVEGAAVSRSGRIALTVRRRPVELNSRPLPKIPKDLQFQEIGGGTKYRGANVFLETHRGCSGTCTFCLVPLMFGRTVRSRPMEDIVAEAKAFRRAGVRRIAVIGGTTSLYGSNGQLNGGEAFSSLLQNLSKIIGKENLISADLRVDQTSSTILRAIKQYTTGLVSFGLESGSDRILRMMGKGIQVDAIHDGINQAKRHGLKINGSFIVGYPGEEEEDFEATKELMRELQLYDYAINMAFPIPGTPLYRLMLSLENDKNPFFQDSNHRIDGIGNLTVAEHRALILQREAYEIVYSRRCPFGRVRDYASLIRSQSLAIREIIEVCRKLDG